MIFIFVMHKTLPSARYCHSGSYGMPISVDIYLCSSGLVDGTAAGEGQAARPVRRVGGEDIPRSCHFTLHLVPQAKGTG